MSAAVFGDARLPGRFWSKVQPVPVTGCWLWTAADNGKGYGIFKAGLSSAPRSGLVYVHRLAFERLVSRIPPGVEIDHLCRVRECVNPCHLEAVTHRENVLRGTSPVAAQVLQTHCKRGHEFTNENTYWQGRKRSCRICRRLAHQRAATRGAA
jgi:hypothetical protein